MGKKKLNCWEYKNCGYEPGGRNTEKHWVCPAAVDQTYEGINSGKCAGRFCWAVAGTFCEGECQETYADKQSSCRECDFFKTVLAEEGTMNLRTKFMKYLSPYTGFSSLVGLKIKKIKRSTRFVVQGERSNEAYIIKRGACILLVEKEGELYPIGHRSQGDIVNISALFTGEPVSAHIEAETDMEVWTLKKAIFKEIPQNDPELYDFLTQIVAARFDTRRPICERSIGPYMARDIIGRGGYSIVYKGIDSQDGGGPVAIKMMRHHMAMDPCFITGFRNEAKIVAGLDHPNIVRVFDIIERFQTIFIIMEYLEGESLVEILVREKRLSVERTLDYLIQVCLAMKHAWSKGVLHRDICPGNIMVAPDAGVKLVDFGIARYIHEEDDELDGSLKYLAPEIFDGEVSSIQSDLYSLGITAYEMLVGKRPYPEGDQKMFMKARRYSQIPDPREMIPDMPDALQRFIRINCRLDPEERYSGVEQALADLMAAKASLDAGAVEKNCWEVMDCGKGPRSSGNAFETICPAATNITLDGMNGGKNAGRACWLIAGTFCDKFIHGTFAEKMKSCSQCRFYKLVNQSQGHTCMNREGIAVYGVTHMGKKYLKNEDRYLIRQLDDKSILVAVADGLGGAGHSEVAAEIVNGTLAGLQTLRTGREEMQLKETILDLDKKIVKKAASQSELERMATTLVCGVLKEACFYWINVGDSRLYLLRQGDLTQVSEDQTLARFLIEEGELAPENAENHYSYNILEQCIGYGECVPQTGKIEVSSGDLLVLSTDGLHKMVSRQQMISILNSDRSIEFKTKALTQAALDGGGRDNVTIVLAKVNLLPA